MWVPINSGNRSGSCSENCGFRIAQVVRCHSENGISYSKNLFLNSESCSENAPELSRAPREWPFHSESVFPEIGVVPRAQASDFLFLKKMGCGVRNPYLVESEAQALWSQKSMQAQCGCKGAASTLWSTKVAEGGFQPPQPPATDPPSERPSQRQTLPFV